MEKLLLFIIGILFSPAFYFITLPVDLKTFILLLIMAATSATAFGAMVKMIIMDLSDKVGR